MLTILSCLCPYYQQFNRPCKHMFLVKRTDPDLVIRSVNTPLEVLPVNPQLPISAERDNVATSSTLITIDDEPTTAERMKEILLRMQ